MHSNNFVEEPHGAYEGYGVHRSRFFCHGVSRSEVLRFQTPPCGVRNSRETPFTRRMLTAWRCWLSASSDVVEARGTSSDTCELRQRNGCLRFSLVPSKSQGRHTYNSFISYVVNSSMIFLNTGECFPSLSARIVVAIEAGGTVLLTSPFRCLEILLFSLQLRRPSKVRHLY